jgi:hypothetical protein
MLVTGCTGNATAPELEPAVSTREKQMLEVGRYYWLKSPGLAARVINKNGSERYPYLIETLILRSRWHVNDLGEPNAIDTPMLIPAPQSDMASAVRRLALDSLVR